MTNKTDPIPADATTPQAAPALSLTPEQSKFIEDLGIYYERHSVPRAGGRMMGLLLISSQPLSAEQMAEALSISRSSVSTNARLLLMSGLIEKIAFPGERVDYYSFSSDAWEKALVLRSQALQPLKALARLGHEAADNEAASQRLQEMHEWVDFVIQFYNHMLKDWRSQRGSG